MNTLYFIVGSILLLMLIYFLRKINNSNKKVIQPKMPTKNKWLYPTDSFGKMEKGVVHDQVTYKRYSKSKELADLEIEAREKNIGLWSDPNPMNPFKWRRN